jgi:hypothetical protein
VAFLASDQASYVNGAYMHIVKSSAHPEDHHEDVIRNGSSRNTHAKLGGITEYAKLPVTVLDPSGAPVGQVQAGIAQFNPGTRLKGCSLSEFHSPTDNGISLDGRMVNFLVADGSPLNGGSFDWTEAGSDAARLAKQYYALSDQNGMLPLTGSVTVPANGSVGYEFTIVVVEAGDRLDAVVYRETVSEKFTPQMLDQYRRASGVLWSSVRSK